MERAERIACCEQIIALSKRLIAAIADGDTETALNVDEQRKAQIALAFADAVEPAEMAELEPLIARIHALDVDALAAAEAAQKELIRGGAERTEKRRAAEAYRA